MCSREVIRTSQLSSHGHGNPLFMICCTPERWWQFRRGDWIERTSTMEARFVEKSHSRLDPILSVDKSQDRFYLTPSVDKSLPMLNPMPSVDKLQHRLHPMPFVDKSHPRLHAIPLHQEVVQPDSIMFCLNTSSQAWDQAVIEWSC